MWWGLLPRVGRGGGGGHCPLRTRMFVEGQPLPEKEKKVRITAFPPSGELPSGLEARGRGGSWRSPPPPPRALLQAHLSRGSCSSFLSPQWGSVLHRLLGSGAPRPRHGRRPRLMNFGVTRGLARIWEPRALIRTHGPAPSKAQPFHPATDL